MTQAEIFWAPVIKAMRAAGNASANPVPSTSDDYLIRFANKRGLANPADAAKAYVAFLES